MNIELTARRAFLGASLAAVFATAGAGEPVGTLSRIEGVTVVSQGAQYVKASEGMQLKEGDRVLVMEGGNAIISFADGCDYRLADNELLTVGQTSTCAEPAVSTDKVEPYSAVSQDPGVAAAAYQQAQAIGAGLGGAGAGGAGLGAAAPAVAAGVVAVLGATNAGGGNNEKKNREFKLRNPTSP